MPTMLRKTAISGLFVLLFSHGVLAAQDSALPQASALAGQSLRPYWHVFVAYTIAIVLVLAWVVSIGRRLRDVEERLGE